MVRRLLAAQPERLLMFAGRSAEATTLLAAGITTAELWRRNRFMSLVGYAIGLDGVARSPPGCPMLEAAATSSRPWSEKSQSKPTVSSFTAVARTYTSHGPSPALATGLSNPVTGESSRHNPATRRPPTTLLTSRRRRPRQPSPSQSYASTCVDNTRSSQDLEKGSPNRPPTGCNRWTFTSAIHAGASRRSSRASKYASPRGPG